MAFEQRVFRSFHHPEKVHVYAKGCFCDFLRSILLKFHPDRKGAPFRREMKGKGKTDQVAFGNHPPCGPVEASPAFVLL